MNKKMRLSAKIKRKGRRKSTIRKSRVPGPPSVSPSKLSTSRVTADDIDDENEGDENYEPQKSPIGEPFSDNEQYTDDDGNEEYESDENDVPDEPGENIENNDNNEVNKPTTPPIPDDNNPPSKSPIEQSSAKPSIKSIDSPTKPPTKSPINPIPPAIPAEENNHSPETPPIEEFSENGITSPIEPPIPEVDEAEEKKAEEGINNEVGNNNNNNLNDILPPVDPIIVNEPLKQQPQEEECDNNIIEPLSSVQPAVNDFIQPNTPPLQQSIEDNDSSIIEKPIDFLPESEYGEGSNYTEPTAQLLFDNNDNNDIYNDNPPPLQAPLFVEDNPEQQQQHNDDIIQPPNNNNNTYNILPPLPIDDNFNNFNNNYENIKSPIQQQQPQQPFPIQQEEPLHQYPVQEQDQYEQPPQPSPPIEQQYNINQQQQQQQPLFVASMEEDQPLVYEPSTIDQLIQQQQSSSPSISPIIQQQQSSPHNLLPPYYPPNSVNPIYVEQPSQYPPIVSSAFQSPNQNVFSQYSTPPNERPLEPPQVSNTTTQTSARLELQPNQPQAKQQQMKGLQRSVLPLLDPTSLEEVAAYYEKELFALFNFYTSLQSGKRSNPNEIQTVNLAEFIKCLKDFDVYNPTTKINRIIVADLFRQYYNPNINIKMNTLTYEQFALCFTKCMAYIISDYPFTMRFTTEAQLASVMIWLLELDNKMWFKKRCKNFAVFSSGDGDNHGHINKIEDNSNIIQYRLNVLKDNCLQIQSEWIDLPTLFPCYTIESDNNNTSPINKLKQPHPPLSQQQQDQFGNFKSPRTIGYEKRMKVERMINGKDEPIDMFSYLQQQQQQMPPINKKQFKQLQFRIAPTLNIAQQAVSKIPYKPPNMYNEQQSNMNRNNNNNNNLITWNEINNFSLDNMQNVLTMNNEIDTQQQQLDQRNPKSRVIQKYINQNIATSPYNVIKPQPMMIISPPFKQSPVQQHLPVYQPPSMAKLSQQQQQQQQQQQPLPIPGNSFSEPVSELPSERSIQHSPVIVKKKEMKKPISSGDKPKNNNKVKGKKKVNNFGYNKGKEKPIGYKAAYKMKNHNNKPNTEENNNKIVPKLPIVENNVEEEPPIKVKKSRDIAREMAKRAIEVAREQKLKEKGFCC